MKFYPADWRSDVALRSCSPGARGIWIDLIGLMHEAEPYGFLVINGVKPSVSALSRLLNVHHKTLIAALKELLEHGVYSVDSEGVIYSRRMVRDREKAIEDQENGRLGGNPNVVQNKPDGVNPPVNPRDKPSRARVPEARSQIEETPSLRSGVSAPPPASKSKRASVRTSIPIDLAITPEARAFAAERGFINGSVDEMWTAFTAYHAAKGTLTATVEGSWRTWVGNQVRFQEERNGNGIGATRDRGQGARSQPRNQPRSAATIIMERALEDELGGESQPLLKLAGS
jgi:hypothetical protein